METYFAENITLDTPEDVLVRDMEVTIVLTPTSELIPMRIRQRHSRGGQL